jgi:hypothetical protein
MKVVHAIPLAAALATSVGGTSLADPFASVAQPSVGAQVSTLGMGLQFSQPIGFGGDVRLQTGNLEIARNGTTDDLRYAGNAHLRNVSALFDFTPLGSPFRFAAGLLFSHDGADISGTPQSGTFTLRGHTYTAAQVGSLTGSVTLGNVAPFVGIGLAPPRHRAVFLTGDVGVALRTVQTSLTASGPATSMAQFQTDLAKTRGDLSSAAGILRTYPVLSLGLGARL